MTASPVTRNVGIYIFDEVEVLDFAGPFEVFSTASRVKSRLYLNTLKPFEVFTIADAIRSIPARGGLMVNPNFDISNHPAIDCLIIPGGVVTAELKRDSIIEWIARISSKSTITASVCTGAFLLAKAGLLHGKNATTHWSDIEDLRAMFPDVTVQANIRWIEAGKVITSAGISAGIDMSLHLVAQLESEDLAVKTARQMEYKWSLS